VYNYFNPHDKVNKATQLPKLPPDLLGGWSMDELWKPHFSDERWGFLAISTNFKDRNKELV
jgi:hypothetical protein